MASTGSFQTLLGIWSVCESGRKVSCIPLLYRCQILNEAGGANASKNKNSQRMLCFSCLTTATRARSRQKIQKTFFSLAAWVGDSQHVMNSLHTAPVSVEQIRL